MFGEEVSWRSLSEDARAMRAYLLHCCDGACQRHHSANRSNEKFGTLSHWRQRLDKLTSFADIRPATRDTRDRPPDLANLKTSAPWLAP
jgi:hypothetical protein